MKALCALPSFRAQKMANTFFQTAETDWLATKEIRFAIVGHSSQVFCRLWISSLTSISAIALEIWDKASLSHSLGVHNFHHTLTNPLISKLSMVKAVWPVNALKTIFSTRNSASTRWEKWFLCAISVRNHLANADQGNSTTSWGSCHLTAFCN